MSKEVEKELVRNIARFVQDREFIYYIYSMLKSSEDKIKMINYLMDKDELTKQQINIKVLEIKLKK